MEAIKINIPFEQLQLEGYECKTTFWNDFTIAEHFGIQAITDTFVRAFKEWKDDYIYLTELVIVTNHKCWQWYERGNENISRLYNAMYKAADEYACETLKGDEAEYYYRTTD